MRTRRLEITKNTIHREDEPFTLYLVLKGNKKQLENISADIITKMMEANKVEVKEN